MNRRSIEFILGKPDQNEINKSEECWTYSNGLELLFLKEDLFLLSSITTTNLEAQLEAKPIIGIAESELLKQFPYLVITDDFEENGKNYASEEMEIAVFVVDGLVVNVTIFPHYEQTGQIPIWP